MSQRKPTRKNRTKPLKTRSRTRRKPESSSKAEESLWKSLNAYELDFVRTLVNSPENWEFRFRAAVGSDFQLSGVVDASGQSNPDRQCVSSLKYRSIARKAFTKQPGMTTELFNKQTIDMMEPVFLVEGEFDALTFEQAGYKAVSLPNAQYQPTPEDKDLLLSAEYVILAGDNDDAGRKAMTKLFREMRERTYLLQWPDKIKDSNQFYLEECKGDISVFRTKITALTQAAKSKPMEGVYDVRQRLLTQDREASVGHPNRLQILIARTRCNGNH